VLTFRCTGAILVSKSVARFGAVVALSAATLVAVATAAEADQMGLGGCIGTRGTLNCVVRWGEAGDPYIRVVPGPVNPEEQAHAAEHERRWEQRCRPDIVQDRYGVPRYQFAAPGCNFGILD
jgi:hypothetical protein